MRNHVHQWLLQTLPDDTDQAPSLASEPMLQTVETFQSTTPRTLQQRAAAIRDIAQRVRFTLQQAEAVGEEIR